MYVLFVCMKRNKQIAYILTEKLNSVRYIQKTEKFEMANAQKDLFSCACIYICVFSAAERVLVDSKKLNLVDERKRENTPTHDGNTFGEKLNENPIGAMKTDKTHLSRALITAAATTITAIAA